MPLREHLPHVLVGAAITVAAAGCGGGDNGSAHLPATARTTPPASVLRIPRDGGFARLYRVPGLTESSWKAAEKLPALKRVVGGDLEQRLVFAVDAKNNLVGLDLESRRVRTFLPQVRHAAIGPDGAVYAVDTGQAVTQIVRRSPVRFRPKLAAAPRALYGTMSGTLVAIPAADRAEAVTLGSDQAQARAAVPAGEASATYLGDIVAIATDTGVVLYEPQTKRVVHTLDISHARAVIFSPSGHRLYVLRNEKEISIIDRFSDSELETIELPGPARELRGDFYGGWLLARPERGDSAWVVDIAAARIVGTARTRWGDDLPVVAGRQTLLVRSGGDVHALDLSAKDFPVTGTIDAGADDAWVPLAWLPAQELATKLKGAGLPAAVLPPKKGDEAYRVVLGPYATREQAEATGKTLGMPSFVITPEDQPAQ